MSSTTKTPPSPSSDLATAPVSSPPELPTEPPKVVKKKDTPFLTNLRRHLTPDELSRVEKTISALTALTPDHIARSAAPLLNDLGVQQALAWSSCATPREFGMVVRGHAFTMKDNKLTLNARFHRILVALVQNSPPTRAPEVNASLLLKIVAASLFMHCCESAVKL